MKTPFNCWYGRPSTRSGPSGSNPRNRRRSRPSYPPQPNLPGVAFTLRELIDATNHFDRKDCIGEGGFGRVYSTYIQRVRQTVAIKKLDLQTSIQGSTEFETELAVLGRTNHPNIVKLIGHCVDGPERLIVYEYHELRSLDRHLFDIRQPALDWNKRVKIALGAAKGLDYLHHRINPPVIYRDMKASNILLGPGYIAKLSDFGLAKRGPATETGFVDSQSKQGTEDYCAPEYISTGKLTFQCDVYSFGVVLLEIFTGRRNTTVEAVVQMARFFSSSGEHLYLMADQRLNDNFPKEPMSRVLDLAIMCVDPNSHNRPSIANLLSVLHDVALHQYTFPIVTRSSPTPHQRNRSL